MSTVTQSLVSWVFTIKYWSLANKLQLFEAGKDLDSKNTTFSIILFVGGALIIVTCSFLSAETYLELKDEVFSTTTTKQWLRTVANTMFVFLFASYLFLIDAFRRMNSVRKES